MPFEARYKSILLIEDDKDDRELFTEMLNNVDESLESSSARNANEAFQLLLSNFPNTPGIIFLDLHLPGLDGFDFMMELNSRVSYAPFSRIPIVVLSNSIDRWRCYDLGAAVCIQKPFTLTAYHQMLSVLLSRDVMREKEFLREFFLRHY